MSRVTIESLMAHEAWAEFCEIEDIEIVPRKMVEMIIERLKINISSCEKDSYADFTLTDVLKYAESLLKQFEEE